MRNFENKIDGGLQYHVLQVDEDTVRKVPKNENEMVETIKSWDSREESIESLVEKGIRRRKKAVEKMKNSNLPLQDLFAVKSIENRDVYQKKLTPVNESKDKDFENIIDDYIDLLHRLWSYGIGDTIYNFTLNNGYRDTQIFQMDFGEVVFDKEKVRQAVEQEKWRDQWTFTSALSSSERTIFSRKMSQRVNVEELNTVWQKEREK